MLNWIVSLSLRYRVLVIALFIGVVFMGDRKSVV